MNISSNYEEHIEITKQLKMSDSFYEVREPYKVAFEEIYNKAKDENITMTGAKDFLNSLSKEEMSSLQHYSLLVEDINVNNINEEGAYNLLLHHYEKYDFDNDGVVSNGISKGGSLLPMNMPSQEKEILVQTLNQMDEKDRFMSMIMINPPKLVIGTDGTFTTKLNNEAMNYDAIMKRVERILNPLPGEIRSDALLATISKFQEIFTRNYEEKKNKTEQYQMQQQNDSEIMKAKINS